MTDRDAPKGTEPKPTTKLMPQTPPQSEEEVVHSYLRFSHSISRLAPEEEIFHSRGLFETRGRLGLLLSHFPRVFADLISASKVTEIQRFSADGELQHCLIDEKREEIVKLLSALGAAADSLKRIAKSKSDDAQTSRELLFGSLEKLLGVYVFQAKVYQDALDELHDLRQVLTDAEAEKKHKDRAKDRLLMPLAVLDEQLAEGGRLLKEMEVSRQILLESNLGLVISVVRKYSSCGMSFQDLFQEGFLGLSVAVDKFQPRMGHRFSTYAVWWIRQGVTQALSSSSRTIRIPANMARALTKINQAEQTLLQKLGREPLPEEIAELVDIPVERVRAWRKMERQPISLESPIGENNRGQISDLIVDRSIKSPDEITSAHLLKESIAKVLDTLSEREREIIIHRFGLLEKSTMTLEELSKRFHVTHERIRQIEGAALKKLRDPERRQYFDGYF